jgi:hypothetical protein
MINFWFVMIGLVSCFLLWRVGFNDFFIDNYRARLFSILLELVDLVRQGKLSSDDPAYRQIRLILNGLIQYAQRVTFARYLHTLIWQALRKDKIDPVPEVDFGKQLLICIGKLPPDTRVKVAQLLGKLHHETAVLMFMTSGLLKLLFVAYYLKKIFHSEKDIKPLGQPVSLMERDAYLAAQSDSRGLAVV